MNPNLIYNIVEERLKGNLIHVKINCTAGSGGRAGTKTKGAQNWMLKNNAFATHVHHGAHNFGPLPQGRYYMRPHEKEDNMVRLVPFSTNVMFDRSGFLIHGRGKVGSHGCIVPYDFSDVVKICDAVSDFIDTMNREPVLKVIAVGTDIDQKFFTA